MKSIVTAFVLNGDEHVVTCKPENVNYHIARHLCFSEAGYPERVLYFRIRTGDKIEHFHIQTESQAKDRVRALGWGEFEDTE